MLVGTPPFETPEKKVEVTYQKIRELSYEFPSNVNLSESCKDLISRILVSDPEKRLTIAEIRSHLWFQGYVPRSLPPHALVEVPPWKGHLLVSSR